jgi:hypothetical protein
VSSALVASVNRPLLRLELAFSTPLGTVEGVPNFRKKSMDEKAQVAVAEYSKAELETSISEIVAEV